MYTKQLSISYDKLFITFRADAHQKHLKSEDFVKFALEMWNSKIIKKILSITNISIESWHNTFKKAIINK